MIKCPTSSKEINKLVNKIPELFTQAPNRKGNQSMKPANSFGGRMSTGGVTNTSPNTVMVSQPKGAQGAPKVGKPMYNTSNLVGGNKANAQPIDRPKASYGPNDSYRNGSSYLK